MSEKERATMIAQLVAYAIPTTLAAAGAVGGYIVGTKINDAVFNAAPAEDEPTKKAAEKATK